ncbi:MAG: hypothetical protein ABUL60_27955 [Myxococcales bacterium]
MSVRLGALVCLMGLAACSHESVTIVKTPSTLAPFSPVPSPSVPSPVAQQVTASEASETLGPARTRRPYDGDGSRDTDPAQRERIRRLSMADGSL